jgi:tRNA 2-thiocytidine biosynthesis protein TtcA
VVAPSLFANAAAVAADASNARAAAPRRKLPVEVAKLKKRLHRQVGRAIADFAMIENGDRVMVCVSGGKDSYSLLDILIELRERTPIEFEVIAVNLDQKQPGFPADVLPGYLAGLGVDHRIVEQDTYSVVKRLVPEGRTMCSLCSRLRRGVLYRVASELGATKIALGHHRDDMVATLFMNMFFGGRLKGMPPKLVSDDGRHVVIRPLAYVAERDLARWAEEREFPIIPCNLCGSQQNLQRVRIGEMLRGWEREDPGRTDRIFDAMARVVPSHLMDRKLFPFAALQPTGVADADGDRAFDDDVAAPPAVAGPDRADGGLRFGVAPTPWLQRGEVE